MRSGGEINKTVVVGSNVEPWPQILTIVPLDEVWVTANFKTNQLQGWDKKLIFKWIQPAETPRILPEKEFGD